MEQRTWQFVTYLTVLSKRLQQRISHKILERQRAICALWVCMQERERCLSELTRSIRVSLSTGERTWTVRDWLCCCSHAGLLKLPTRLIKVETHDSQLIQPTPFDAFLVNRLVPGSARWSGWKWVGNTRLCLWNHTSNVRKACESMIHVNCQIFCLWIIKNAPACSSYSQSVQPQSMNSARNDWCCYYFLTDLRIEFLSVRCVSIDLSVTYSCYLNSVIKLNDTQLHYTPTKTTKFWPSIGKVYISIFKPQTSLWLI